MFNWSVDTTTTDIFVDNDIYIIMSSIWTLKIIDTLNVCFDILSKVLFHLRSCISLDIPLKSRSLKH